MSELRVKVDRFGGGGGYGGFGGRGRPGPYDRPSRLLSDAISYGKMGRFMGWGLLRVVVHRRRFIRVSEFVENTV